MSKLIPNGFITVEGDYATLSFRRRLEHRIEDVWAAIVDPEQRADWFAATVIDGQLVTSLGTEKGNWKARRPL